jgi:hypothetical protein
MSQELGFQEFKPKYTDRFHGSPDNKNLVSVIPVEEIGDYKTIINTSTIECEVAGSGSIYIDYEGRIWPCCYLAQIPYKRHDTEYNRHNSRCMEHMTESLGTQSLKSRSLRDIVDGRWTQYYTENVANKTIPQCTKSCRIKK